MLNVLNTGAGKNLIRSDILKKRPLNELDRTQEIVNLASPSKHGLDVLGIAELTITVATHTVRITFVVIVQIGTDVILG